MAAFSWASALDVGLGLIGGMTKGSGARAQASANNAIREANNSIQRSATGLAKTMQDINNRRILASASKNLDGLTRAAIRQQDAGARQGFEASIQEAEAAGRVGAAAAAAGVGGASVAAMSSVAGIAAARAREYRKQGLQDASYETVQSMTNVMGNAFRSLDGSPLVAQQDFTQDRAGSTSSYLLASLLSKKDSLHTLLGSIQRDKQPEIQGPPWISPWAPEQPTAAPGNEFAFTTPVADQFVKATPLPTIRLN